MVQRVDEAPVVSGVGRSAGWSLLQVAALSAANLLIPAVALREVGPQAFGFAAAVSAAVAVVTVLDLGLSANVIRTVASMVGEGRRPTAGDDRLRTVETAICVQLWVAAVIAFSVTVCGLLLLDAEETIAVVGFGLGAATFVATSSVHASVTGERQFSTLAASAVVGAAVHVSVVLATIAAFGVGALGLGYVASVLASRAILVVRVWRSSEWFPWRVRRPKADDAVAAASFGAPLLIVAASSHVVTLSDIFVVGATAGTAAVAFYRIGSLAPTMAVNLLYRVFDVVYPHLSAVADDTRRLESLRILNRLTSYVAGLGFGFLIAQRSEVIRLLAGEVGDVTMEVLVIFALVWLVNVPVHGLVLLLMAADRHRFLAVLVAVEAVVNVLLSLVLAPRWGATGVAWATLATITISNSVVLPRIASRRVGAGVADLVYRAGYLPAVVGLAIALGTAASGGASDSPLISSAVHAGVAVGVGVVVGSIVIGPRGRQETASVLFTRKDSKEAS